MTDYVDSAFNSRCVYDAIECGVADLSDPALKTRIEELKATRDQARIDAKRCIGTSLDNPDFQELAEGFGVAGLRCDAAGFGATLN